jgi:hypothetical protein
MGPRRLAFEAYASRFRANAVRRKNVDDAVARAAEPGGMKKARGSRSARLPWATKAGE